MRTAILVLDDVLDSSLALTLDVLHATNRLLALGKRSLRFEIDLVGPASEVTTGCGLPLRVPRAMRHVRGYQLVFVPGMNVPMPDELTTRLARPDISEVTRWLAREHARGALVAGSCVGSFLLAEAGLLRRAPATTSWWLAGEFRKRYPDVELKSDQMVTKAGRVICGGAALAQMDVALTVVTALAGPHIARLVARYLVIERRPTQARYALVTHLAAHHEDVEQAEGWIRAHLEQPFRIEDVARATGTSPRTLARRIASATGSSPIRFVQRIRAEQATHFLETTTLSIDEIAARVGYADASTLRRVLRRETGTSAREVRAQRVRGEMRKRRGAGKG